MREGETAEKKRDVEREKGLSEERIYTKLGRSAKKS